MGLMPSILGVLCERDRWEDLEDYHIADCIECGSCAFCCPAYRPLVQLFKRGKAELRRIQKERQQGAA